MYAIIGIAALAVGIMIGVAGAHPSTPPPATAVPTQDLQAIRTEAVGTFAAGMTGTASALPTAGITETQAPATAATGGPSGTPTCLNLLFVRDVTIPDNTAMTPAQVFTKTWLVQNNGTCPWQAGFKVILVGGVAMGGSPFPVTQVVGPGGRIQVSIKMVAPTNQTGIVQGTWQLADDTGKPFGEAMWVTIVVGTGTGTAPGLPTAKPSLTPTP